MDKSIVSLFAFISKTRNVSKHFGVPRKMPNKNFPITRSDTPPHYREIALGMYVITLVFFLSLFFCLSAGVSLLSYHHPFIGGRLNARNEQAKVKFAPPIRQRRWLRSIPKTWAESIIDLYTFAKWGVVTMKFSCGPLYRILQNVCFI